MIKLNSLRSCIITFPLFLFFSFWETFSSASADPSDDKLVYWYRNYDIAPTYKLLQLALSETKDLYGDTVIVRGGEISQGRAVADLKAGKPERLRLVNVVPDPIRQGTLRPIYIAGDGGLVGLRICVIKPENQKLFGNIRSYNDLQINGIVFGQGEHWPDVKILMANGLNVITSAVYEPLFAMLRAGRFNCFLRSVGEIVSEIELYNNGDLAIEENLLFSYPSTSLFFVNKEDRRLAARLELGLRRAILNGRFSQYFHETFDKELQQLALSKRRVFRMNNPLLTDDMQRKLSRPPSFIDAKIQIY